MPRKLKFLRFFFTVARICSLQASKVPAAQKVFQESVVGRGGFFEFDELGHHPGYVTEEIEAGRGLSDYINVRDVGNRCGMGKQEQTLFNDLRQGIAY